MKILFLDDNLFRHEKMKRNSIGFSVTYVVNADDCIAALRDGEFDLIMLDHDLDREKQNLILDDEMDGRYVTRWMAAQDRHKDVPVIIHSLNEAGRNAMEKILVDGGFTKVAQLPFAWTMIEKGEDGGVVFDPNKPRSNKDYT